MSTNVNFCGYKMARSKMDADPDYDSIISTILDCTPKLSELCRDVQIGPYWYTLGIQLDLDENDLNGIKYSNDYTAAKTSMMFGLWLNTNPGGTRKDVVEALKAINKCDAANNYIKAITREC